MRRDAQSRPGRARRVAAACTVLLLGAALTGTATGADPRASARGQAERREREPAPATELVLRIGQSESLDADGLTMQFDRVVEDSRCPMDVTCVWAGDAVVRLTIGRRASTVTVDLRLSERGERERVEGAYRIRLERLLPERVSTRSIDAGDYRAHLSIARVSSGQAAA